MLFWTKLWLLGARTFKLYPNMQYVTFPAPATWRCGHCQILQLNCVEEVTMCEKFDRDWTMYLWEASLPWRPVAKTQFSTAQVYFYWSKFQFTSKDGSSESTSGLFEQQTKNTFCICLQDDCLSKSRLWRTGWGIMASLTFLCSVYLVRTQFLAEVIQHNLLSLQIGTQSFLYHPTRPTKPLTFLSVVGTGNDWVVSTYPLSKRSPVLGWKLEMAFISQKSIQKSFCLSEQWGCTTSYWKL